MKSRAPAFFLAAVMGVTGTGLMGAVFHKAQADQVAQAPQVQREVDAEVTRDLGSFSEEFLLFLMGLAFQTGAFVLVTRAQISSLREDLKEAKDTISTWMHIERSQESRLSRLEARTAAMAAVCAERHGVSADDAVEGLGRTDEKD
jgi:hypothetical protein